MTNVLYSGGCACGAVRFVASAEPYRVGICHCMTCRKVHGAAFHAFAVFPAEAVRITGAEGLGVFASSKEGRRFFCRACGSPVYETYEHEDEIALALGSLDEPSRLKPTYELWMPRRESWLPPFNVERRHEKNRPGGKRTEP